MDISEKGMAWWNARNTFRWASGATFAIGAVGYGLGSVSLTIYCGLIGAGLWGASGWCASRFRAVYQHGVAAVNAAQVFRRPVNHPATRAMGREICRRS
jgi:hypothetical protein